MHPQPMIVVPSVGASSRSDQFDTPVERILASTATILEQPNVNPNVKA